MPLAQGTTCDVFTDLGDSTSQTASSSLNSVSSSILSATGDTVEPTSTFSDISRSTAVIMSTSSSVVSTFRTISSTESSTRDSSPPASSQFYSGPDSNFPSQTLWLSFNSLWNLNKGVCELNQDGMAQVIHDNIQQVASGSGVDPRVIFAVILQESTCLLSAGGTGLMQSHNGVGYTDQASILQMIKDGTEGTSYIGADGGDGLQQLIDRYGVYGGLRAYNSGDFGLHKDNLSSTGVGGLPSYVSDIANRLVGAIVAH